MEQNEILEETRRTNELLRGQLLWMRAAAALLAVGGGRPLSSSTDALRAMYTERRPLYLAAADAVVPNHTTVTDAVNAAMEALDEIFDH